MAVIRFYLDEHFSEHTARFARSLGLDVVTVDALGRKGWSDEDQLTAAAADRRVFVTMDARDLVALTHRFQREGRAHAGVLLVSSGLRESHFAGVARALAGYAELHPDGVPDYFVDFLHEL